MVQSFTSEEVLESFEEQGFKIVRQSGTHAVLRHPDGRQSVVVVPLTSDTLPLGTVAAIKDK